MTGEQLHQLDVNRLHKSAANPRISLGDLTELTESIRHKGVVQALTVRKREDEDWEVVIGERRLEAAKRAGLRTVPCIVKKMNDAQAMEESLVENLWREDLSPLEKATAIRYLLEKQKERYSSQAVLANVLGVTPAALSEWLSILDMPPAVQAKIGTEKEATKHEKVSLSHARVVKRLEPDAQKQEEWLDKARNEKWSVSQTEKEIEKAHKPKGEVRTEVNAPLVVSLPFDKFVEAIRDVGTIELTSHAGVRVPEVGEEITITTPKIMRKVKAIIDVEEKDMKIIEVERNG